MRIVLAALALGSFSARDCSLMASTPPPPAATASMSASLALPAPAHGGVVVAAQDAPVEVVVQNDGYVHAYPVQVQGGVAVPTNAVVYADVHTTAGQPRTVEMHWVPAVHRFEGRVVGVTPAPGPLAVRVDVEGRVWRSPTAQLVVVHPAPAVHVHADVPRPAANVQVRAEVPRPSVHADVHVHAPPPPGVHVEVAVPRPPSLSVQVGGGAYVEHHHVHGKHHKHHGPPGRAVGHHIGRGHRHH